MVLPVSLKFVGMFTNVEKSLGEKTTCKYTHKNLNECLPQALILDISLICKRFFPEYMFFCLFEGFFGRTILGQQKVRFCAIFHIFQIVLDLNRAGIRFLGVFDTKEILFSFNFKKSGLDLFFTLSNLNMARNLK